MSIPVQSLGQDAEPVYYQWEPQGAFEEDMPPRGSTFLALMVILFTIGTMTFSQFTGWNYVVRGMGAVLVLAMAIRSIQSRVRPAPESVTFFLWVAWATTGLLALPNERLFWESYMTILQMAMLLFVVSCVAESRKIVAIIMFGFLIGAGIVGLYSIYTGEYQRAESTGERVVGLVGGANGFAWYMFLCSVCLAYLWMQTSKRMLVRRILILAYMFLAMYAIVLSGSRKGFLGLVLFYMLWLWYCYRKVIFRRMSALAGMAVVLVIGGAITVWALGGSKLEDRLLNTWTAMSGGRVRGSGEERILLIKNALVAFTESPVVGIGLDNVRLRNPSYSLSHCEYAELLGNTGLPGFLLYFSIYFLFWRRSVRLAKHSVDPKIVALGNLGRAFIVTVLVLSLGRWNYTDKAAWVVLGTFIGYSTVLWRHMQQFQSAYPQYACLPEAG